MAPASGSQGALKAFIESLGLGISAYRDMAPEGTALPYIVIVGPLTLVPDRLEDGGSKLITAQAGATRPDGTYQTCVEQMQIDLFQQHHDPTTNAIVEVPTLPDALVAALQGCQLPGHPKRVYACTVRGAPRLFERTENVVHHPITLDIHRQL